MYVCIHVTGNNAQSEYLISNLLCVWAADLIRFVISSKIISINSRSSHRVIALAIQCRATEYVCVCVCARSTHLHSHYYFCY